MKNIALLFVGILSFIGLSACGTENHAKRDSSASSTPKLNKKQTHQVHQRKLGNKLARLVRQLLPALTIVKVKHKNRQLLLHYLVIAMNK